MNIVLGRQLRAARVLAGLIQPNRALIRLRVDTENAEAINYRRILQQL